MKRVVTGPRAVVEALRARGSEVHAVYVQPEARKALGDVAREAKKRNVALEERPHEALDALAKGHKHQGVVAITGAYPYVDLPTVLERAASPPLLVALDQITDPHNFGAIVRSAVAFGADGVLTLKRRAAPVTPVVVRASAGATEHARIARITNLARTLAELADRGWSVVGLDAGGGVDVSALPPAPEGRVLVVGAEGKGLRRLVRERCTELARIDQRGPVASLNASVAASIALFCCRGARFATGQRSADP
ncbi:MAG TPA: 23S rRNA (guanosine(2251)-2'-O)-methyltransferase RlmB [Sandaracinaceae bacterium LLY-WYZ-13_1]|nr:23S rRNA (guanosine(2251)-2'-O)-methyltransferase RlmB [Sandaracinaceae bacterium LLY-WYZ-13_1]